MEARPDVTVQPHPEPEASQQQKQIPPVDPNARGQNVPLKRPNRLELGEHQEGPRAVANGMGVELVRLPPVLRRGPFRSAREDGVPERVPLDNRVEEVLPQVAARVAVEERSSRAVDHSELVPRGQHGINEAEEREGGRGDDGRVPPELDRGGRSVRDLRKHFAGVLRPDGFEHPANRIVFGVGPHLPRLGTRRRVPERRGVRTNVPAVRQVDQRRRLCLHAPLRDLARVPVDPARHLEVGISEGGADGRVREDVCAPSTLLAASRQRRQPRQLLVGRGKLGPQGLSEALGRPFQPLELRLLALMRAEHTEHGQGPDGARDHQPNSQFKEVVCAKRLRGPNQGHLQEGKRQQHEREAAQ